MVQFSTLSIIAKLLNIVAMTFFIIIPLVATIFLWRQKSEILNQRDTKQKFGSLYLNLKTNSKSALTYTSIYLIRRLILCVTIMTFSENSLSQAVIALISSMSMITYLLVVKPHRSPNTRMFELYNETTILVVTYLLMMNIELITDDQLKFTNGWVILAIISACILANLINVVTNMTIKIKRKIQSFFQ